MYLPELWFWKVIIHIQRNIITKYKEIFYKDDFTNSKEEKERKAMEYTHFDQNGNAVMVDVSEKAVTKRVAVAKGSIRMSKECFDKIKNQDMKKGDVLGVARIAGIMGAKKTSELIPLCHLLNLTSVTIDFKLQKENNSITVFCEAKTTGKTGVEMEALTGVQIALLTIYDMCKAVDKTMEMYGICLCSKSGGKSGDIVYRTIKGE